MTINIAIKCGDTSLKVPFIYHIACNLAGNAKTFLTLPQRLFRPLALGDVFSQVNKADKLTVLIK